MTTNVMVRDLDLLVLNATDSRRLEVVVDGLPLFGSLQWTRRWCVHSTVMASLTEAQLTRIAWSSLGLGGAKS